MNPNSLFSLTDHLEKLSQDGDQLEVLGATVDFEYFRTWLVEGLGYGDGSKGGRAPFDPVSMFRALILQTQQNLSDAKMEFMIRDRVSWMRFLGFDLGGATPDENTIRHFRDVRPDFPPAIWRIRRFVFGLMRPAFATPFLRRIRWA